MSLFKKSAEPEPTPEPEASVHAPGGKKSAPTPTRREAEAARRARLNPQLSPKEARRRERQAQYAVRDKQFAAVEASPARTLMRDHVDAVAGGGSSLSLELRHSGAVAYGDVKAFN